jgi:SpoVK/Ycf46/Vps4 family AAA+-type ATPase
MPQEAEEPILAPNVRAAVFEWLTEVRAADDLKAVGIKPRRTALLYGPPGCGKTTLAHHFAARLGLPLACVRSESLVSAYLGSTGQNIGQLFDAMAETEGKVVVFFDEVDALGGRRMNDQGASVERANSLNVLLRRIERFDGIASASTVSRLPPPTGKISSTAPYGGGSTCRFRSICRPTTSASRSSSGTPHPSSRPTRMSICSSI